MNDLEKAREIITECDAALAAAFEKRMQAVADVARFKKENNLPVTDSGREKTVIEKSTGLISDPELKPYFGEFMRDAIEISKRFQRALNSSGSADRIPVNTPSGSYDIILEKGALARAGEYINLSRKVLVLTDEGVPAVYAETLASQCGEPYIYTVPQGEGSKSIEVWQKLLSFMLEKGFSRKDCVAAVGGGVVGDLAGFTASAYMRGIDFYNIPTTVLSQVDSSIGGKTAVNLDGIKNIVGAFCQPKAVIVDINTLVTLPGRQVSNGLAEALKAGLIADEKLFEIFESGDITAETEQIIRRSLCFKRNIVEQDEKETGIRKILNFGHTIGHGIESEEALNGLYHGECVALGMIPMCSPEVRERLVKVLKKLNLPVSIDFDIDTFSAAVRHDKKGGSGTVSAVVCEKIGTCEIREMTYDEIIGRAQMLRPAE